MDVMQVIEQQVKSNPVILSMKGTPQFPQCGFSAQAVEVMTRIGKPFAFVNILEAPEIRAGMKEYANWPTFPQLWVSGELVGGSDIILEMYNSGELQPMVEEAAGEAPAEGE